MCGNARLWSTRKIKALHTILPCMSERIGFCVECCAKQAIEGDESCMCGGRLKPTADMADREERRYRREWSQLATMMGDG